MILPRAFLILSCLLSLLGGCVATGSNWETRTEIFVDKDDVAFVEGALSSTIDAFNGSGSGPHPVGEIPPDFLENDPNNRLVYTRQRLQMLGGRVLAERPFSQRAAWVASASASLGRSDYRLPNGAGILVEPINIKFRTVGIDLAAGTRFRVIDGDKMDLDVTGTAGIFVTRTKTHIGSPVLDVTHWETQDFPYISLALRLTPDLSRKKSSPRPYVTIGARGYPGVGGRYIAEFGMQF